MADFQIFIIFLAINYFNFVLIQVLYLYIYFNQIFGIKIKIFFIIIKIILIILFKYYIIFKIYLNPHLVYLLSHPLVFVPISPSCCIHIS